MTETFKIPLKKIYNMTRVERTQLAPNLCRIVERHTRVLSEQDMTNEIALHLSHDPLCRFGVIEKFAALGDIFYEERFNAHDCRYHIYDVKTMTAYGSAGVAYDHVFYTQIARYGYPTPDSYLRNLFTPFNVFELIRKVMDQQRPFWPALKRELLQRSRPYWRALLSELLAATLC